MSIDPNTGGVFFQILLVAAMAAAAVMFVFARNIRSGLARVRRRITRPSEEIRIQRRWRD